MASNGDAPDGMSHEDIYRYADRLARYAERVISPLGAISALLFMEGVEHPPTWYELVNRFDQSRFVPLRGQAEHPEDYPHVRHGLTRWTLRPLHAPDIDSLDALAFHVVTRCCVLDTFVLKRAIKANGVKYRFVMATAGGHSHTGVITFAGDAVAKLLAQAGGQRG